MENDCDATKLLLAQKMATAKDERPHLVLVTLDTCAHSITFRDLWNQFIEDPMIKLNYQVEHVAHMNSMNSISITGPQAYYYSLVKWFPWLMLIKHEAWAQPLTRPPDLDTKIKVCNGKFTSGSGVVSINYVNEYPPTYTGILQWLRHCHDQDPSAYPSIEIKPRAYFSEIHDVAARFSLSPFWASAYRNRDLPFAPDSRKVIGSSYLSELEKRRKMIREQSIDTTKPNLTAIEYQTLMQPLLNELRLLGLMEQFDFSIALFQYCQMIQRHLELLIQVHTV